MATDIAPSLGHSLVTTQAGVAAGFDAIDDRRFWGIGLQEGVIDAGSYEVKERASGGPGLFVDIAASTGTGAVIQGDSVTAQGKYHVPPHSALITEAIAAADATNPRVDQAILEGLDDTHAAGGLNKARVRILTGTATSLATLDNRTGAAALPASAVRLADVLVPALDTTISNLQIRDRRPWARGAYYRYTRTAGDYTTTTATMTEIDTTNLKPRIECSGGTIVARMFGSVSSPSGKYTLYDLFQDGVALASSRVYRGTIAAVSGKHDALPAWSVIPAAGSHLFSPAWRLDTTTGTATIPANATDHFSFEIEEIITQNARNNATTSG